MPDYDIERRDGKFAVRRRGERNVLGWHDAMTEAQHHVRWLRTQDRRRENARLYAESKRKQE